MPEPSETDWAYVAGFVDGEGCIAVVRNWNEAKGRFNYGVHVVVANRDRAVFDWMQTHWAGYVVAVSSRVGRAQPCWNWRCTGPTARQFLEGIAPWLRLKQAQCSNALKMIAVLQRSRRTLGRAPLPSAWLQEQEGLYWIQRELNHRGTDAFVRKPMHSPRKIHRARLMAAASADLQVV